MRLNSYKVGKLIEKKEVRNSEKSSYEVLGLNIDKEFMPTVADLTGVDLSKYKVIKKDMFVFSGMQTGRDNTIRLGYYTESNKALVSPAYTVFVIKDKSIILPEFFFMIFKSKEKDRYGAFLSDTSVRANLDWNRYCEIDLEVPDIDVQKKYVDVYNSLLQNHKSIENKLKRIVNEICPVLVRGAIEEGKNI